MPYFDQPFGQSCYHATGGEGPPLLLLNGLGYSHWSWSWQWNALPELRLIALENRGVGGSDLGSQPFELVDLADDAIRLLDHLEVERAHVWGVSMGGMIAQELALKYPQRCAGLILGCTMCGGPEAAFMTPETLEFMASLAREGMTETSVRQAMRLNFSDQVSDEVVSAYVPLRMQSKPPLETWNWQRAASGRFDVSQRLSSYKGPVLLMHGDDDAVVPSANLPVLQRLLPQAESRTYAGARHLYWIEHAREVNQQVADFVCRP